MQVLLTKIPTTILLPNYPSTPAGPASPLLEPKARSQLLGSWRMLPSPQNVESEMSFGDSRVVIEISPMPFLRLSPVTVLERDRNGIMVLVRGFSF